MDPNAAQIAEELERLRVLQVENPNLPVDGDPYMAMMFPALYDQMQANRRIETLTNAIAASTAAAYGVQNLFVSVVRMNYDPPQGIEEADEEEDPKEPPFPVENQVQEYYDADLDNNEPERGESDEGRDGSDDSDSSNGDDFLSDREIQDEDDGWLASINAPVDREAEFQWRLTHPEPMGPIPPPPPAQV